VARSRLLSGFGSRLWAWERLTVVWVVWVHGPHIGPWWAVSTLLFPSWLMVEQLQTAAAPSSPYLLCYSCGSMLAEGELAQRRPVVARHGSKGGQGGGKSGVVLTPWSSGLG